jgi:hypothetical protein
VVLRGAGDRLLEPRLSALGLLFESPAPGDRLAERVRRERGHRTSGRPSGRDCEIGVGIERERDPGRGSSRPEHARDEERDPARPAQERRHEQPCGDDDRGAEDDLEGRHVAHGAEC